MRRCVSRGPNAQESALLGLLNKQRARYAAKELNAADLVGDAGKMDAAELASWTTVARVLLNLDETITKE